MAVGRVGTYPGQVVSVSATLATPPPAYVPGESETEAAA